MSDLVERLRGLYDEWNSPHSSPDGLPTGASVMLDAAAEIERLRGALRFYADESLEGYDFSIIDYGLRAELGEIIKDGGAKARAALEERT